MNRRLPALLAIVPAALAAAGCGAGKSASSPPATTTRATTTAQASTSPGALQGEAASVATGDIPDNQVFLTFLNAAGGYSMKYPEGWAQSGAGKSVTIRDKNNIVRVVVAKGGLPTAAAAKHGLAHVTSGPSPLTIAGSPALKVVYTTESAPNPVTGKRVTLVVDRYYLSHGGRLAIVDLGTPQGVDNVDAYRLMVQSFRWK